MSPCRRHECNFQSVLSKTIRIGDTKYHIKHPFPIMGFRACQLGCHACLVVYEHPMCEAPLPPITSKVNFSRKTTLLGLFIYLLFLKQKADMPMPKHRRQLTTWQVFRQVKRRFHTWESNWQSLP